MSNSILKNILSGLLFAATTGQAQNVAVKTGEYNPDWESLSQWECPDWFRDAKFGIWAHWGPQCQAEAGDWYARHMYYEGSGQYDWHVSHFGNPSEFGLKDLCNAWKAEEWNPESLVQFYKSVGARYFFTLGQHHDNFDLWDSPYQEWNSVNVGPKKDIVKGWSEACRKYGLPLGISMHGSHAWTWLEKSQDHDGNLTKEDGYTLNDDGTEKWWKGLDPQELYAQNHEHSSGYENSGTIHSQWTWGNGASLPSETYKTKFQNRVLQCINDYNPDMLYFDDTVLPFYGCDESVGLNILSHYYNHSSEQHNGTQNVVVMGKVLESKHKKSMLWDVERGIPDRAQEDYWQTCTCLGDWHYNQSVYNDSRYKSAQQVVSMLVDIVSKNGNLLLSVPIRGNGSIDEKEIAILNGIKAWMDINSSSIYGTRPWKTFGEGPLAEASNPLTSQGFNENNNYSSSDVRYAQRNDTLYATIMRWPAQSSFTFTSLAPTSKYYSGKVKSVRLLGYGPVEFQNEIDGLRIQIPEEKPNEIAPVFCIEFNEGDAESISLAEWIELYEAKIAEMQTMAGYDTGKYNRTLLNAFAQQTEEAKAYISADPQTQQATAEELKKAYEELKKNGKNEGGEPGTDYIADLTEKELSEASRFARKDDLGTRFGTPLHWTVENYSIPNGDDGIKNGLDKYTGDDCLSLGIWQDRQNNEEGNLTNARIYQKIHLEAGRYYFGATYNTTYGISDQAYIFASADLLSTGEIPEGSFAYYPINKSNTTGQFTGISFTLKEAQDIYLGFQADLNNGNDCQEFRVNEVKLLQYADDYYALDELIYKTEGELTAATVNQNTGFYKKAAVDQLSAAVEQAMQVGEDAGYDEIMSAYNALKAAYDQFITQGKNPGGQPNETGSTDITEESLLEAANFSRLDPAITTRYATPLHWQVDNFSIPNGNDGTKNGIDKYPGYDCLMLGIWGDKDKNEEGDLSNARISRTVRLKAGRYYFGAIYQTTYNLNEDAYIFASAKKISTSLIPTQSIAYYPINRAPENGNDYYGIYFTIDKEQDVELGFQANLLKGNNEQEMRVREVKLLYYGEINAEKLKQTIDLIESDLSTCIINANTGHYSSAAYDALQQVIDQAKQYDETASYDEISEAYENLTKAYADFLQNGKNPGGNPDESKSYDITTEKMIESSEFTRTEETAGNTRFGKPLNWTVENYSIPRESEGTKNGLDKYPGYDCLMLGVWDDREKNTQGDLTHARLYRTIHLEPGRYYFGGVFNALESMHTAYIFAADAVLPTDEIEKSAIAYYPISQCLADGKYHGIYFTIDEAKDIVLGFQADLSSGNARQEFRVSGISLLSYTEPTAITPIEKDEALDEIQSVGDDTRITYYDLTGTPLPREPEHGFYIRRQGHKSTKAFKP